MVRPYLQDEANDEAERYAVYRFYGILAASWNTQRLCSENVWDHMNSTPSRLLQTRTQELFL